MTILRQKKTLLIWTYDVLNMLLASTITKGFANISKGMPVGPLIRVFMSLQSLSCVIVI